MYRCPFCGKLVPVVLYGDGYVSACPDCKQVIYNSNDEPKYTAEQGVNKKGGEI